MSFWCCPPLFSQSRFKPFKYQRQGTINKDEDSGHYNTFIESGVLTLATEKGRENFKESIGLAGEEVAAIGRVIDTTINKQEDDKRNPITVLGEEREAENWRNSGLVEDFKNAKSQEEMAEAIEKIGAKEGYEVEVIYTDSSNYENLEGRGGQAYIDSNGKIVILVNTEVEGIGNKDVLAGILAEELSHGINYANGKDKGAGTETLAGHSNDYFIGKLGDNNTSLSLTGDGKDYNNVDFGTHVGDKAYFFVKDQDKIKIINEIYSENGKNYKYNSEVKIKDEDIKNQISAIQMETGDKVSYVKDENGNISLVINKISDSELQKLDKDKQKSTLEWREVIESDTKNAYYVLMTNEEYNNYIGNTSYAQTANADSKSWMSNGKMYTNNVVVSINNRDSLEQEKNPYYLPYGVDNNYGYTIKTEDKRAVNHEDRHLLDMLVSGLDYDLKTGKFSMTTSNVTVKGAGNEYYQLSLTTPTAEFRAVEYENVIYPNEKRALYYWDAITNLKPIVKPSTNNGIYNLPSLNNAKPKEINFGGEKIKGYEVKDGNKTYFIIQ